MSPLPPYWRHPEEEESTPLYKGDLEAGFKDPNDESNYHNSTAHGSSSSPTYPPGLSDAGGPRSEVTYTFVPQWPVEGTTQDALGVLGHSKEETLSIVRRGFPIIANYPADRVEFLAPVKVDKNGEVVDDRWGIIMDEAWVRFKAAPPLFIKVRIRDNPGDGELRNSRKKKEELREGLMIFFYIFLAVAILCIFLAVCAFLFKD